MSSILDALRKLEEEKSNDSHDERAPIYREETAEQDLIGGAAQGSSKLSAMLLSPAGLIAAAAFLGVVVIAASATGALLVLRSQIPTTPPVVASLPSSVAAPAPATPTVQATPAAPPVVFPAPVAVQPIPAPSPTPVPSPVQNAEAPAPSPAAAPPSSAPVPVAEPVAEQPKVVAKAEKPAVQEPRPSRIPGSASATTQGPPFGPITDREDVKPDRLTTPESPTVQDVRNLPILSEAERTRLGLPKFTINMVAAPTPDRPRPSAMVNYNIVYIGDTIQGSRARLVGVDVKGIAVDIDGALYFAPARGR